FFLPGQRLAEADRRRRPARDREARRILGDAQRPLDAAGLRARHVADDPGHLRIVERLDDDLVVGTEPLERRVDGADLLAARERQEGEASGNDRDPPHRAIVAGPRMRARRHERRHDKKGAVMIAWTEKTEGVIAPDERLPWPQSIAMGAQHVVAMFGATVLAPLLMGFDPNVAVLMSGVGTLVFFLITAGKVPSYLGSSFAFI